MTGLNELTATEAATRLAAGEITSEALVRDCLDRIRDLEDQVGAWAFLDPDLAIAQAREIDGGSRRGPLHGLPIGVKDIVETSDMPTEYSSEIYKNHRPETDADCVRRMREAGAVIMGKTVTTEFAVRRPGKTANPHDPERTPGGSSSGSAAGVAVSMVPLACGTQTSGSVSRPASFCGVVGYKPTFGLHVLAGVKEVAGSFDTLGFFGRIVADTALYSSALLGQPLPDLGSFDDAPPRIGLCRTPWWDQADPATQSVLEEAGAAAGKAGAKVGDLDLPEGFDDLIQAHKTMMDYEAIRAFAYEYREHRDLLSPDILEILDRGVTVADETYAELKTRSDQARDAFGPLFDGIDVLLAPSVKGEAPKGLGNTGDPLFTRVWTMFGAPSVTVPGLTGPSGMPVGVEVVGPRDGDAPTLAAAAWIQRALG